MIHEMEIAIPIASRPDCLDAFETSIVSGNITHVLQFMCLSCFWYLSMSNRKPRVGEAESGGWTFLTNHAHILLCLALEPDLRVRDLAGRVGITERAVHKIISELEAGGVLAREKSGRRNSYSINPTIRLRHPVESHRTVGHLIRMVNPDEHPPG